MRPRCIATQAPQQLVYIQCPGLRCQHGYIVIALRIDLRFQQWEYEGCGQLVRVGNKVQHFYPNASAVHLVFKN